jgi:hypothetical protein
MSNKERNMFKAANERHYEKHHREKLWSLKEMIVGH